MIELIGYSISIRPNLYASNYWALDEEWCMEQQIAAQIMGWA